MTDDADRATTAFLAAACGDALGRPLAGLTGSEIARAYGRVTELRGGPDGATAGSVTGELHLAVGLARSLVDRGGFDGTDAAARYADRTADDSAGVEPTTARAARRLREGTPWTESGVAVDGSATGPVARAVPLAVRYAADPESLGGAVAADAAITHDDTAAVEASVALARVVAALVGGATVEAATDAALDFAADRSAPAPVRDALAAAGDRALATADPTGPVGVFETGLNDGLTAPTVDEAVTAAVNRGGHPAALGVVAGAVAGARPGTGPVPPRWLHVLDDGVAGAVRSLAPRLGVG